MSRTVLVAVGLLLLAGCVVKPPVPQDTECGNGIQAIFLKFRSYPDGAANGTLDAYSVDRSGDVFYVRGVLQAGRGEVNASDARLVGLTAAEVRTELQRAGLYRSQDDVTVNVSWRARMSSTEFNDLCRASAGFFSLPPETKASGSGCSWKEFTVNSQRGVHTARVWCADPPAFRTLDDEFNGVTQRLRASIGAPA